MNKLDRKMQTILGNKRFRAYPSYPEGTEEFSSYKKPPEKPNKEWHIPGYNFCGPGTQVEERLARGDWGVNHLDNACRVHDIEYMMYNNDAEALQESDKKLMTVASKEAKRLQDELDEKNKSIFMRVLGFGFPIIKKMVDFGRSYDIIAANSVAMVFKGKNMLENFGIIDPKVTFYFYFYL